jgi:hypothetical protein
MSISVGLSASMPHRMMATSVQGIVIAISVSSIVAEKDYEYCSISGRNQSESLRSSCLEEAYAAIIARLFLCVTFARTVVTTDEISTKPKTTNSFPTLFWRYERAKMGTRTRKQKVALTMTSSTRRTVSSE